MGLIETVELARALGLLPPQTRYDVIEGRIYDIGILLSPESPQRRKKWRS